MKCWMLGALAFVLWSCVLCVQVGLRIHRRKTRI